MNGSPREKGITISDMTDRVRSADPIFVGDSGATKTLDAYIFVWLVDTDHLVRFAHLLLTSW